ncbi:MAG: hypothetical protein JXA38_03565 [Methanosarcinaceae archaeon]|nr:hypothetical protein [Methanosarcinaceae archaeon]
MSDHKTKTDAPVGADRYLTVAIHQLMEECGWKAIETNFGIESHNMVYIKPDSLLEKIEVKANVHESMLNVSFLGTVSKKGLMDKLFDLNVQEIRKTFNIAKYVSQDMKIQNEQRLRNVVTVINNELENTAKK